MDEHVSKKVHIPYPSCETMIADVSRQVGITIDQTASVIRLAWPTIIQYVSEEMKKNAIRDAKYVLEIDA